MKQLMEQTTVEETQKIILLRCRAAVMIVDPGAEVILYGSRARGDADPDSDYDLLVLTDGEAGLAREDIFRQSLFPIELDTGCVLTVILLNRTDWNSSLYDSMPFYQNVKREGILV